MKEKFFSRGLISAALCLCLLLCLFACGGEGANSAEISAEFGSDTGTDVESGFSSGAGEASDESLSFESGGESSGEESPTEGVSEMKKSAVNLNYRTVMIFADEFEGEFEGTKVEKGFLTLDGAESGSFVSEAVEVTECDRLLLSWNSYTNGGTVEVSASYEKSDGEYSRWFSFGVWSSAKGLSASRNVNTSEGSLDIDTLDISEKTTKVRFKVVLKKTDKGSPILWNVSITNNGEPLFEVDVDSLPREAYCDVPLRSQLAVPGIGNIICSPTSTSMLLEYLGCNLPTADVAAGCFDYGADIYGNWLFNVAFAAEQGFNAHYDSYDVPSAMNALANGIPMAFSIKTVAGQIANAPQAYTNGHLIVVVGYKYIGDELYFIVNDPAVSKLSDVRREYKASELESGWKNCSVYVYQKSGGAE